MRVAQLQSCPFQAVDVIDTDPQTDFLVWTWACPVTMDLPSDPWAASDPIALVSS